jgi:hypothetical protein
MRLYLSSIRTGLIGVAAVLAIAGVGVALPGDAWAQAGGLPNFEGATCRISGSTATTTFEFKGVGNENVCVVSSGEFTGTCACQSNSGQCPNAANKAGISQQQTATLVPEVKNGRIRSSITVASTLNDQSCATLEASSPTFNCGSGQDPVLASRGLEDSEVTFEACLTTASVGQPCSCPAGATTVVPETTVPCTGTAQPQTIIPQCL